MRKAKNPSSVAAIAISVAAIALSLGACVPDPIAEGVIIAKDYKPKRTWTTTSIIMVGKVAVPQTIAHVDDEDFVLVVEGLVDGKEVQQRLCVPQDLYERHEIGDRLTETQHAKVC